jgi:Zn-finger nucleic acid-binding protein/predicted acylesterase/phospholipase RssA
MTYTESGDKAADQAASPFGAIAISLSGGGLRAMGYHLGTLSYLDHIGLLEHVTILSSVSGGSFTGIKYALSQKQGKSFQQFYDEVLSVGREVNLFADTLNRLGEDGWHAASGRRNLVTALGDVYDKYFDGLRFDYLWNDEHPSHLREVVFNATEFQTGLAFRFVKSDYTCRSGNERVWIEEADARKLRLSDIMASSSSVPGGFEPLFFPEDYRWPDDQDDQRPVCNEIHRKLSQTIATPSIAIMDGGVYDNQGIASVLLAVARQQKGGELVFDDRPVEGHARTFSDLLRFGGVVQRASAIAPDDSAMLPPEPWPRATTCPSCSSPLVTGQRSDTEFQRCETCQGAWVPEPALTQLFGKEPDVGMFIVSDTPVLDNQIYQAKKTEPKKGPSLEGMNQISWFLIFMAMACIGMSLFDFYEDVADDDWHEFLPFGLPVVLVICMLIVFILVRRKVVELLRMMPVARPWATVKSLRVSEVQSMMSLRASSLFALSNDIFLNRIRYMGYALLYSQPQLMGKIVPQDINTLLQRDAILPSWNLPLPSRQMMEVVVPRAAKMPTKLWFDKPDPTERSELDTLIACGQLTLCFNLLRFMILRCPREPDGRFKNRAVQRVFDQACQDWQRLVRDAYVLVDAREAGEPAANQDLAV